ncbi:LmeA family phospholipid-binding protein [Cellulomonas sp. P5_E12]
MSGRGVVVGVVAVVVVVGGAFVADRVTESVAEQRVVDAIEQNLDGVVGTPTVELGGFPFLNQLMAGSIDDVTGQVDGVTLEGIKATDVTIDAQDVSTSEPYTVGSATIEATLPTATIEQIVKDQSELDVAVAVDGNALKASGKVLGLTLAANLVPRVEDGKLLVNVENVQIAGLTVSVDDLPNAIGKRLTDIEIPVSGLPEGVALSKATVVSTGVRITATGTDVVLPAEAPAAG